MIWVNTEHCNIVSPECRPPMRDRGPERTGCLSLVSMHTFQASASGTASRNWRAWASSVMVVLCIGYLVFPKYPLEPLHTFD